MSPCRMCPVLRDVNRGTIAMLLLRYIPWLLVVLRLGETVANHSHLKFARLQFYLSPSQCEGHFCFTKTKTRNATERKPGQWAGGNCKLMSSVMQIDVRWIVKVLVTSWLWEGIIADTGSGGRVITIIIIMSLISVRPLPGRDAASGKVPGR